LSLGLSTSAPSTVLLRDDDLPAELARWAHASPFQLARIFRAEVGTSLREYVCTAGRCCNSRQFVTSTGMSAMCTK
jgi:AraC-like DNA-binding protein